MDPPQSDNLCLSILGNFPELFPFMASPTCSLCSLCSFVCDGSSSFLISCFPSPCHRFYFLDGFFSSMLQFRWMVSSALCYNFLWNISSQLSDVQFPRTLCIFWRFKAPLLSCPSCINAKAMLSFCRIREQLRQPRLCSSPHQPSQDPCLFLPVTCSVWRPMAIYPHF